MMLLALIHAYAMPIKRFRYSFGLWTTWSVPIQIHHGKDSEFLNLALL
jgi:hypothetical protein